MGFMDFYGSYRFSFASSEMFRGPFLLFKACVSSHGSTGHPLLDIVRILLVYFICSLALASRSEWCQTEKLQRISGRRHVLDSLTQFKVSRLIPPWLRGLLH